MDCQCLHEKVCPHPSHIRSAMREVIIMRFGGVDPVWHELEEFVRKNCQHRIPSTGKHQRGDVQMPRKEKEMPF